MTTYTDNLARFREALVTDAAVNFATDAYCAKRSQYGEDSVMATRGRADITLDPTAAALLDAIYTRWTAER